MQYLKGKMHLSIIYGADINKENQLLYGLVGYVNSNYAGDLKDRKSVMGHCFFLNGGVVSWYSKKQQIVSTSTSITKAEDIILGLTAQKNVWIRQFLNKLNFAEPIHVCVLHGNNETSIILTKNAKSQARIKHINV